MNALHIFSFLSLPSIVFVVAQSLSHVQFFAITRTVAHQVPLPMGLPRQECWSGLPFLPPVDLLDPGMELTSPTLADRFFTTKPPVKPSSVVVLCCAQLLSRVQLFATPWTVACQSPLSMGSLQARILEWVVVPSSRGSSWIRDQAHSSYIGRQILYH